MLTSEQSLELTLPNLITNFNNLDLPFERKFDVDNFKMRSDIGVISFDGNNVLLGASSFFKLTEDERLAALVFIAFCMENYSEYLEIRDREDIDGEVLNFASHFYALKQLNDAGFVFEPESLDLVYLQDGVSAEDTLTKTYESFLDLGIDNVIVTQ